MFKISESDNQKSESHQKPIFGLQKIHDVSTSSTFLGISQNNAPNKTTNLIMETNDKADDFDMYYFDDLDHDWFDNFEFTLNKKSHSSDNVLERATKFDTLNSPASINANSTCNIPEKKATNEFY
jgi:hypothetical protein